MKELKYDAINSKMYFFFLRKKELEVRTVKGVQDEIYAGVFKQTLKSNFDSQMVSYALKKGIIKKATVGVDRKGHRVAYYYALENLKQVGWFKRMIEWVKSLFVRS